MLDTQAHLEVVGVAADGEDAVTQAEALKPDVVVLDVRMPKSTGIEAAKRITSSRPDTGIVMISNYDDPEYILELMGNVPGGKAYLLKTSVDDVYNLLKAVEAVAVGQIVLDPGVVRRLERLHASSQDLLPSALRKELEQVLSKVTEE